MSSIIKPYWIDLGRIKRRMFFKKYCIISSETLGLIKSFIPSEQIYFYTKGIKIYGLNVAICEDLKYGEFLLR